jgi:hypothetical protein
MNGEHPCRRRGGVSLALINVMMLDASYPFSELDETRIRERFAGEPDDETWA